MKLEEPVISERFDLDDIRKIREYDSLRYLQMTPEEILADIHEGAKRGLERMECLKAEAK